MDDETQVYRIIEQLEEANRHLARQNSVRHSFFVGVVYGVGFFIGSAILATIMLGLVAPYLKNGWVGRSYETGATLRK